MLPEDGPFDSILEGQLAAMAAEREQFAAEKAELQERLLRAPRRIRKRAPPLGTRPLGLPAVRRHGMVRDMLPILDDFERALKVDTADRDYAKGVELIYQRMADTLKKLGLEPIETAGQEIRPQPAPGRGARADRGGRGPGHSGRVPARI